MPHGIAKLYSGRSERQKQAPAQAVTAAVIRTLGYGEEPVSVGIDDVNSEGLDRAGLQAGHHRQAGHDLQGARIRAAMSGKIR
jgi:phenylpyruvate tautomerase PptA (4-oxalocrotonate tautomerase family)